MGNMPMPPETPPRVAPFFFAPKRGFGQKKKGGPRKTRPSFFGGFSLLFLLVGTYPPLFVLEFIHRFPRLTFDRSFLFAGCGRGLRGRLSRLSRTFTSDLAHRAIGRRLRLWGFRRVALVGGWATFEGGRRGGRRSSSS